MVKSFFSIAGLLFIVASLSSCGNVKNLQYMQGSFDTARLNSYSIPDPVVQKGDLIGITVYSDNPTATAIYNQSLISNTVTTGTLLPSASAPGYLVDLEGNIQFQGIGKLHIEGLTRSGLSNLLDSKLTALSGAYWVLHALHLAARRSESKKPLRIRATPKRC